MAGSGCNAYQIRKIYAIGGALGMVKRNEEGGADLGRQPR